MLGTDERGREILRFVPGQTWGDGSDPDEPKTELVMPREWPGPTRSERTLGEIGALCRRLHDASQGFQPAQPIWREYELPMRDGEIVCHGDIGPWNLVYRGASPVGIIDWDSARPARPIDDLAWIAWHVVPLAPDDVLAAYGFTPPYDTARRLRLLCDAYGLSEREPLLQAISFVKQMSPMSLRYWQPLRAGGAARWLRIVVRDLEWLEQVRDELRAALA